MDSMEQIVYRASAIMDMDIKEFNEKVDAFLKNIQKIETSYKNSVKEINSIKIAPQIDFSNIDTKGIQNLTSLKTDDVKKVLDNLKRAFADFSKISMPQNLSQQITSLQRDLTKLRNLNKLTKNQKANGAQPLYDTLGQTVTQLERLKGIQIPDFSGLKLTKANVSNLQQLPAVFSQIKESLNGFSLQANEALASLSNLVNRLDGLKNLKSVLRDPKVLEDVVNSAANSKSGIAGGNLASAEQKAALDNRITKWLQKNTAAAERFKNELREIQKELKNKDLTGERLKELKANFLNADRATISAGRNVRSFSDALKNGFSNALRYASTFATFYDFIRYFRQGIQIVKDYDKAFTEMKKVSNDGISELRKYQKESFVTANEIATTAKQLQESAAGWMRLGENINKAKESAKQTSVLFNVAEFEDISGATDGLVAVSQAYQNLDKSHIVDVLNNVGNNFAISTEGLTQALQRSAAVLSTQGNDIYKASALLTAGNSITQNPQMTGAGIRTIALRIAGTQTAKEELEASGEAVDDYIVQTKSKTDQTIRAYTKTINNKEGISVLDDNGNLRETYDILLDISRVYKDIQKEDKEKGTNRAQALVEFIAGKNRSNIAASILSSPQLLEEAYETALDSEGSAQRELDSKINSVEGQLSQLTNSAHEFWTTFLNGDSLTFLANLGEGILKFSTGLTNSLTSATQLLGLLKDSDAGGGGGITLLAGLIGGGFMTKNGVG